MNMNEFTLMIDSGVGGLSVLALARKKLPEENFLFYADAANAPYGDKKPEEIRALLHKIIQSVSDKRIKAILIACNTATSAAAAVLREELDIPVIGVEPALKPAVLNTTGQVVVLATRLTIREEKFRKLLDQYKEGRDIVPLSCPGLMEIVEKDPEGKEAGAYLEDVIGPYRTTAEAVVLGCTHYIFLRPLFGRLFPEIRIFDGNEGVTNHLGNVLAAGEKTGGKGILELDCSITDPCEKERYLQKCRKMLEFCDAIYGNPELKS